MAAGKGMDEAAAVPLSEHVQYTRLVEMCQVHQILHLVHGGGISLRSVCGGEGGGRVRM